jgi:hypothetical protein
LSQVSNVFPPNPLIPFDQPVNSPQLVLHQGVYTHDIKEINLKKKYMVKKQEKNKKNIKAQTKDNT